MIGVAVAGAFVAIGWINATRLRAACSRRNALDEKAAAMARQTYGETLRRYQPFLDSLRGAA